VATKAQIVAELKEKGVEFDQRAVKAVLEELLEDAKGGAENCPTEETTTRTTPSRGGIAIDKITAERLEDCVLVKIFATKNDSPLRIRRSLPQSMDIGNAIETALEMI